VHATKVIQKWARGMLGRKKMKKLRMRHKDEIEREYDFIESSLKFSGNQNFNLKSFLKDKQQQRKQSEISISKGAAESIAFGSAIIEESIAGEKNATFGRAQPRIQTMPLQNNFFREPTQRDPLSIIEIFARKQHPAPLKTQTSHSIGSQHLLSPRAAASSSFSNRQPKSSGMSQDRK